MKRVLTAVIGVTVMLAACGGAATPAANATAAGTLAAATAATAASTTAPTTTAAQTTTTASTTKASANNATATQLQAAFEAAGVPNASRWVIEVQEYRPYPADDPTFAKLKRNLAKYNPSADTLSRILGALALP